MVEGGRKGGKGESGGGIEGWNDIGKVGGGAGGEGRVEGV